MPAHAAAKVIGDPWAFVAQTLKAFRANQGLLLAGAVAYYALLSLVPLMVLAVIALSHVIAPPELLATLGRYLESLVPGQSKAIVAELANFLTHRDVIGWVLLGTMLFFSSLAFSVPAGLDGPLCGLGPAARGLFRNALGRPSHRPQSAGELHGTTESVPGSTPRSSP